MFIFYVVFCFIVSIVHGVRFNAKEINSNFQAVNKQLIALEQKVHFLKNRTQFYEKYLRNSTGKHFSLKDMVNRLHQRINDIEVLQNRGQDNRGELEKTVASHTLLIHATNTNLQNKVNNYHSTLLRRLEKIEQENTSHKQNIQRMEEKISAESTKNRNLYSRIHALSEAIRTVHNNMTRSIEKLRNKHEWLAAYMHNKTIEDSQLHNMVREIQNNINDLEQHLYSLEAKTKGEEKKEKINQETTRSLMKRFKKKLLDHLRNHKQSTQATKRPFKTTTTNVATDSKIVRTLKPKTSTTTESIVTEKKSTTLPTITTTTTTTSTTTTMKPETPTPSTNDPTTSLKTTTTTELAKSTTKTESTTLSNKPKTERLTTTTTAKIPDFSVDNIEESSEMTEHFDNGELPQKPLEELINLLQNGGYRNNTLLWGKR